jgi:very-short-patch-repair endonuclease
MAATLATNAVLSHRSAGALWALRPWTGRIELTVPRGTTRRQGLLLHRAVLADDEITVRDGIPVTTLARTLLDLAAVLQRHQLQQAINEAERLRLEGPHHLAERYPTKRGTRALRALAPPTHTKQDLEARFHTFLNDRRFPRPQTNILIEGKEVDFAWPDRRLIVELDSWEFHRTRHAFEDDRRTDRRLKAAGWTVIRITWRDLDEPDALEAELSALGLAPGRR